MDFSNKQVQNRFLEFPKAYRNKLLKIRTMIFEVALENKTKIGNIEETLKWGEPSYRPTKKNTGTTVRLSWFKSKPNQYGVYFHCQTSLIKEFKLLFGDKFRYEGKRAIVFKLEEDLPESELKHCLLMALSYHLK